MPGRRFSNWSTSLAKTFGRALVVFFVGLGLCSSSSVRSQSESRSRTDSQAQMEPTKGSLLVYSAERGFRIPFNASEEAKKWLQEVQLWVSTDQGESWGKGPADRAGGDRSYFIFRAPSDGEYWFAVRSIGIDGKVSPPRDAAVEPGMKVVVDSTPPSLIVEPLERRGSMASVRWEARDEHLKSKTLYIEYQVEGVREWRRVPIRRLSSSGQQTWDAGTAEPIRVRAGVSDEAGNKQDVEIRLPDGSSANPAPAVLTPDESNDPPPIHSADGNSTDASQDEEADDPQSSRKIRSASSRLPADDERETDDRNSNPTVAEDPGETSKPRTPSGRAGGQTLRVSSSRFPLKYNVEDAGPSGPALVELWVTRDNGRSWTRLDEDADRTSPYDVDLGGEGTYGLSLVVRSASGLGDMPPAPGDRPQIWVEVDSTPPIVQLDQPRPGTGANAGKLVITWNAEDQHLAPRSVQLSYKTDQRDSTWKPITNERIDNTGRFVWNVPARVPDRLYVRVDVYDAVGNRGSADTTGGGPIVLDRVRPKGRIIGLDQGPRGDEQRPRR